MKSEILDVELIRRDFPILKRKINGKRLVYLDNAATTQKPQAVIDCLVDYYTNHNANIHRGVHLLSVEATEAYEASRAKVASFINAGSEVELIFTRGTTESINLVRYAWAEKNLKRGDVIVTTLMEHHSDIVPWQLVAKKTGASIRFVGLDEQGRLKLDDLEDSLRESPRLVAVSHCSNVLGTINDVSKICRKSKQAGAITVVDAAQSVPHMPVDVRAIDCDFLAFSVTGDTPLLVKYENKIRLIPIEEAIELHNRGVNISALTLGADNKAKFEPVKDTVAHLDQVYELRYENSALPILATAHHSVFVWRDGNLVEARVSELRKGDYLVTLNSQSRSHAQVLPHEFSLEFTHDKNIIREKVGVTKELARLIGYYLAEGSVDPADNRVSLVFSETETAYVEDVRSLIENLEPIRFYSDTFEKVHAMAGSPASAIAVAVGVSRKTVGKYFSTSEPVDLASAHSIPCHLYHNKSNHTANLSFNNAKWFEFFRTFCGAGINKHLPDFMWDADVGLVAELLKGYLRGDASKNEKYRLRVKSVSKRLISELSWLLKLNGISNTLGFSESRARSRNDIYWLVIQRSELAVVDEFHSPVEKQDAPRDKLLCVDALRDVYRRSNPKYNAGLSGALRNRGKRTTRRTVREIVEWIRSTHRSNLSDDTASVLTKYENFANGDFGLIKVRSVRPAGEHLVYDVSIDGTERFFGGYYPLLLHNSGHKMLGPTGIGALYGRRELLEEMDPFQGGGDMIKEVRTSGATWNELPYKFEAGTSSIADAIALGAAVDYLSALGMQHVREHEVEITRYAMAQLREAGPTTIYGPEDASERGGVVSFNYGDIHPHDLASILDEEGIAIRSGHHCAQPLIEWLKIPAASRASFYVYNSFDDVDAIAEGLRKAGRIFAR